MGTQFELRQIIIPTGVAHPGTTVAEAFRECVTHNVPGIPFCDSNGTIVGRVSVRHIMKMTCIPDFLVKGAHLLGDRIEAVRMPADFVRRVLQLRVDSFVIRRLTLVKPVARLIKVMATMEQDNTEYAFVIDDDGDYLGVVTRIGIAGLILGARP